MVAAYPVIQTKTAAFASTTTPAGLTLDDPLQLDSANSAIIVLFAASTTSRQISSISDTEGGTYFRLGQAQTTNNCVDAWISTKRSGNPTISITLNAATAGSMAILEVADLSRGTTAATVLDPTGSGTNISGGTTSHTANQYQNAPFSFSRSVDQLVLVVANIRGGPTMTFNIAWKEKEQNSNLCYAWKLSGAPGAIAKFQPIGTSNSAADVSLLLYLDLLTPKQSQLLQPAPFKPGYTTRRGMRGV